MTAKELFEEYGLNYEEVKHHGKIEQIIYSNGYKYSPIVIFTISNYSFKVCYDIDSASNIDTDLLQAINKQVEELGWNKENK